MRTDFYLHDCIRFSRTLFYLLAVFSCSTPFCAQAQPENLRSQTPADEKPAEADSSLPPGVVSDERYWVNGEIPPKARTWYNGSKQGWDWRPDPTNKAKSAAFVLDRATGGANVTSEKFSHSILPGDRIIAHIFIPQGSKATQVSLGFYTHFWWHRAAWGDVSSFPKPETSPSRGPVPAAGKWVRLEVDAASVGMKPGMLLRGMSLVNVGCDAYWNRLGVASLGVKGLTGSRVVLDARRQVARVDLTNPETTDTTLDQLASFRHLTTLDLSGTRVTAKGIQKLQFFQNLRALTADSCSGIDDEALLEISRIPSLQTLSLRNTQVTDDGMPALLTLGGLRTLRLRGPKISDASLEFVKALSSLRTLELHDTAVTDSGVNDLLKELPLAELNIVGTRATAAAARELRIRHPRTQLYHSNEDELKRLGAIVQRDRTGKLQSMYSGYAWLDRRFKDQFNSRFRDEAMLRLAGEPQIKMVSLPHTFITDAGMQHLAGLSELSVLNLHASGATDAGLVHIAGCSNLRSLALDFAHVEDDGLRHLTGLTSLSNLSLSNTLLTNVGLQHVGKISSLTSLNLYRMPVTDAGLAQLTRLQNIRSLNLHGSLVTDEGVQTIASLKNLTYLNLQETAVSAEGVQRLRKMLPGCRVLHSPVRSIADSKTYSKWCRPTELTRLTAVTKSRGNWLTAIEGRWNDGHVEFRIREATPPSSAARYWHYWFLQTKDQIDQHAKDMKAEGFTLAHSSSFALPNGSLRYQVVWHKTEAPAGADLSSRTLYGASKAIGCVAFSPDGLRFAVGGNESSIRICRTATMAEELKLPGHTAPVTSVSFSPDGKLIATASEDRTVRLWDAKSGKPVRTLSGHKGHVLCLSFHRDSQQLASGGGNPIETAKTGEIILWNVATGTPISQSSPVMPIVHAIAFSPDGKSLAYATQNGAAIWDPASNRTTPFRGLSTDVKTLAWSSDAKTLAAGSKREVTLWNVETGTKPQLLKGHVGHVNDVAFSRDGRRVATAGEDRTIRLWDTGSGRELAKLSGHSDRVVDIDFSLDGLRLVSASGDRTARLWEVSDAAIRSLSLPSRSTKQGAVQLDGRTGHIAIPSLQPDWTSPFTVEAWVMPGLLTGSREFLCDAQNGGMVLGYYDGVCSFLLSDGSRYVTTRALRPAVRREQHVAGVFDGQRIRLFINGEPQGPGVLFTGRVKLSGMPLLIGANPETGNRVIKAFSGNIDEVRISSTARYTSKFTPDREFKTDKHTIAHYHLDETSGSRIFDYSGRNHHGILRGAQRTTLGAKPVSTAP